MTTVFLTLILFSTTVLAGPLSQIRSFDAEKSLVEIEVTRTTYNYNIPWITGNTQTRKNGIVIAQNRILTTADGLSGQYLCRVRKGGQSRHYTAEILWIDYHTNIALLRVNEDAFWNGMRPVKLAKTPMSETTSMSIAGAVDGSNPELQKSSVFLSGRARPAIFAT